MSANNPPEELIFSDDNVSVTSSRLIIRGTTYAVRNITSVKMGAKEPSESCAVIFGFFGLVASVAAISKLFQDFWTGVGFLAIAGVIVFIAVREYRGLKTKYFIIISTASGESNVLTAEDGSYIERIVNSVNEALVRH